MRRSLVLTDETARHPFLASLPPHVRTGAEAVPAHMPWRITVDDVRQFFLAYFACLLAVGTYIA